MAVSHGDLFSEIGWLVLAANSGEALDLGVKSKELARRYQGLGVSEAIIARIVSRSIGAIEFSKAAISNGESHANGVSANGAAANGIHANGEDEDSDENEKTELDADKSAAGLFPSGVRLAVLS